MTDPAPFGSAVRSRRSGWRASALAAIVLLAVVAGALWWHGAFQRPGDPAPTAAVANGQGASDEVRDARATALVAGLGAAWEARSRPRFLAAAGSGTASRTWAAEVFRNLRLLHVGDVTWRYVAPRTAPVGASPGPQAELIGDVEVSWTPGAGTGFAPRATSAVVVALRFVVEGRAQGIVGAAAVSGEQLPVWLAGPLHVLHLPGVVCVGVGGSDDLTAVGPLARRAVRAVRDVVPDSARPAVVVVPSDAAAAAWILGSSTTDVAQIAAVTTTVDGSSGRRSSVQVVINPPVFDGLGNRGAQVVLTHELTHAMTGATTAAMPLWVAEGFADFVALHDRSVPLDVAAGQMLARVRRQGPPQQLPADADFGAATPRLATSYEAAWLVFRMLGDHYRETATVTFYQRVRDGDPLDRTLRAQFGIGVRQLTGTWRSYLDRLATA